MSTPGNVADFEPGLILRALEAHHVRYVVIGAIAAIAAGAPILTTDLDVTPARSHENLERLALALRDLDAKPRSASAPAGVPFPIEAELACDRRQLDAHHTRRRCRPDVLAGRHARLRRSPQRSAARADRRRDSGRSRSRRCDSLQRGREPRKGQHAAHRSSAERSSRAACSRTFDVVAGYVQHRAVRDDIAQLTSRLVAIDSVNPALVPGGAGETEIARFIADWARGAGLEADVVEGTAGRPSVIVRAPGTGGGRTLLLCGHTDTVNVEGMVDPHTPRVDGDRLYGRGAYDMKAGLAAALIACREAAADGLAGDVVVAAVADEEHASLGVQEVLAFRSRRRGDRDRADRARRWSWRTRDSSGWRSKSTGVRPMARVHISASTRS